MKRVFSLFLSIVMLLSITAGLDLSAYAETYYISGDYEYTILDDGTAEVKGYTGSASDLTIASTLDGYTVTSIGYMAFSGCDSLKSINIMNKNCDIYDIDFTISDTATIYVYKNSTAQKYAEKYGRKFVALDKCETHKWNNGKITKPVTATSKGIKTYTCTVCGATKTETIMPSKPGATTIKSVSGAANGFTINWTKVTDTTGYQIQYATKSDFSNAATIYGGATNTTSKTVTGRAKNTTYYVRVRTYKNINGSYVWGNWSTAKTVKTK